MRKILLGLFLIISSVGYTQTYKYGAGFTNGVFFKVEGTLTINEKQVIFEVNEKDKKTVFEYDVIKKTNGMLYFTDGVMKHFFTFINEKGTKKGFDYDTIIVFNYDKSQSPYSLMYYCKIQE